MRNSYKNICFSFRKNPRISLLSPIKDKYIKSSKSNRSFTQSSITKSHSGIGQKWFNQREISSSPESIYDNFNFRFANLRRTINNFQRTKKIISYKKKIQFENFHTNSILTKVRKRINSFFLTCDNFESREEQKESFIYNKIYLTNNTSYINHQFLPYNIKLYPSMSHQAFTQLINQNAINKIKLQERVKTLTRMLENKENIKEKIEKMYYSLEQNKNLMDIYFKVKNEELAGLREKVSIETKISKDLVIKRTSILVAINILKDKIKKQKREIFYYKGIAQIIEKFTGKKDFSYDNCDMKELLFDSIKYKEDKIISLIEMKDEKDNNLKFYKDEFNLHLNDNKIIKKREGQKIKESELKLERIKEEYSNLCNVKDALLQLSKNTLKRKMTNLSKIKISLFPMAQSDLDKIGFELRCHNFFKENTMLFTAIAASSVKIIQNIEKKVPQFLYLNLTNVHANAIHETLNKIIRMKYNRENIENVTMHILLMLKIIEGSYLLIMQSIEKHKANLQNGKKIIDKFNENLEKNKKTIAIKQQKEILEQILEEKKRFLNAKYRKKNIKVKRKVIKEYFQLDLHNKIEKVEIAKMKRENRKKNEKGAYIQLLSY